MPQKHNDAQEDIIFEDDTETQTSGFKGKSEKKLRAELKQAHTEKQEYLNGWQRAKADLINFKKEAETARNAFAKLATRDLLEELLPVLDSFDMALAHDHTPGIEQVHKQLMAVLKAQGLVALRPERESFDPHVHESVESVPVKSKKEDGLVHDVIQTGYMLGDTLIRPAKVKVGTLAS